MSSQTSGREYDIVVIGGGPAGSTFASLVAETGLSVLVVEAAQFPRFAVGEIIAPTAIWRIWHRLGLTPEMLDDLFLRKWGGVWQASDGKELRLSQDVFPDDPRCHPFLYNLERADYDLLLLNHAAARGVQVLQKTIVQEIRKGPDDAVEGVKLRLSNGEEVDVACQLVVDASGRANVLARMLNLRRELGDATSFSCFAHYRGVQSSQDSDRGLIRIIFHPDMWFWWAPLKHGKASVGLVAQGEKFWQEYEHNKHGFLDEHSRKCPFLRTQLQGAELLPEFHANGPWSGGAVFRKYRAFSQRLVGKGWAIVGDAAAFVDPLFAAGLFVAQESAILLCDAVRCSAARAEGLRAIVLKDYETRYWKEFGTLFGHIEAFSDACFEPRFVDHFVRMGNKISRIKDLYTRTFIAHDPEAMREYGSFIKRYVGAEPAFKEQSRLFDEE